MKMDIRESALLHRRMSVNIRIVTFIIFHFTYRISDSCNPQTCPEMTAGPHYTYLWTDENHHNSISVCLFIIVHS